MKLIVDAQLPGKLCDILNSLGLDTIHVDLLPKGDETPDFEIIDFADKQGVYCTDKGF